MKALRQLSTKTTKIKKRPRPSIQSNTQSLGFVDLVSSQQQAQQQLKQTNPHTNQVQHDAVHNVDNIIWTSLPNCVWDSNCLMVVGVRDAGKTSFCDWRMKQGECVVLDCDLGRNACLEGCVSLRGEQKTWVIWVGEFSPLNNLTAYLQAVAYLYSLYRKHLFHRKLIVNTMGYTTGLGELLLYELFHLLEPPSILLLSTPSSKGAFDTIRHNICQATYVHKLYLSHPHLTPGSPTSTSFYEYQNDHACRKKQKQNRLKLWLPTINTLEDILAQEGGKFWKHRQQVKIYQHSNLSYDLISSQHNTDMRVVLLGTLIDLPHSSQDTQPHQLFQVCAVGFGISGGFLCQDWHEAWVGVVCEALDLEKTFYQLNENQLLQLELKYGRVQHLMVAARALGSKGVRNTSSKSQV